MLVSWIADDEDLHLLKWLVCGAVKEKGLMNE